MAINQKNGNDGEFDEDIFEGEDFNDQDFDAEAFDESEYVAEMDSDENSEDAEFDDGDWQEEGATPAGKQKSLYQSGEKKGLSFNTIVIIGAVVVGGGVMMMTMMNKSAEVSAGNQTIFQSMLSMVGVMDGELAGPKEPETPATEQQSPDDDGFLNNPSSVEVPPQPVPMAPEEMAQSINEPLVPMPEDVSVQTPRGPEETAQSEPAQVQTDAPAPITPSAEDVLKQAMANRAEKLKREEAAEEVVSQPVTPAEILAPAETQPLQTVAAAPSKELVENTVALEGVKAGLDEIIKRMERMEGDIVAVRNSNDTQYAQMEKTISSLQSEIGEIKSRPVAQVPAVEREKSTPVSPVEKVAKKTEPVKQAKKKAAKPISAPTTPKASTPQSAYPPTWQLRAAQPGRAWVSKMGQRDMQGIEVGQNLAGLGRVTAITYQNGRWFVIGTQGTLAQ